MRRIWWLDSRTLLSDSIALMLLAVPVLVTLLAYFGLEPLLTLIERALAFDRVFVSLLVRVMAVQMGPFMVGTVYAFVLIEERDSGMRAVYAVSPVSPSAVAALRLAVPTTLQLLLALAIGRVLGVASGVRMAAVALLLTLEAPMVSLFLGSYAPNRLGAMSLSKGLSSVMIVPLLALGVPWPLSAWVLLLPPAWPLWIVLADYGHPSAPAAALVPALVLGAAVYHLLLIALLAVRFRGRST